MVKILDIQQGTDAWYDLRKNKLGASCAPIICGISPYSTAFELYQKMKGITPPEKDNPGLRRGKILEAEAIKLFEIAEGIKTYQPVGQSEIHECLIASMDAVCTTDLMLCAEVKSLDMEEHARTYIGDIPDLYFPQLQHQMFVFELDSINYISYHPEALIPFTNTLVPRDNAWLAGYLPKALAFMDCILTDTPPALTDKDYHNCTSDEEFKRLQIDYMEKYNAFQIAEGEKEQARKAMIDYAAGRRIYGDYLKVTRYVKQGQVQYSKIPELQMINLDKYRGPSVESYRIDKVKTK